MYVFLFLLFRVVVKRRVGAVGMGDILVLVIIADAAQNGMSGEYRSVTEAFILVGTIIGWNTLIDWLTFRSEWLHVKRRPSDYVPRIGRVTRRQRKSIRSVSSSGPSVGGFPPLPSSPSPDPVASDVTGRSRTEAR